MPHHVKRLRFHGRSALCGLIATLLCQPAFALDPAKRISQYRHTAWPARDGVFADAPASVTQTTDGYLWIGTLNGVLRFDGVRFVTWRPPQGALPDVRINALKGARDGSLWIGTHSGLARWKEGRLTTYYAEKRAGISTILEDAEGGIWVSRYGLASSDRGGAICRVVGVALRCFGEAEGVPLKHVYPLAEDSEQHLWMGSYLLCRWKPGSICTRFLAASPREGEREAVNALAADSDGSLWIGTGPIGRRATLFRFIHGALSSYHVPGLDHDVEVVALAVDRDDALWIGTLGKGIYRLHNGRADRFGSGDGLSSDDVRAFYEDREGNLWVATAQGLDSFADMPVATFSTREGLIRDGDVSAILTSRTGAIWIASVGGLVTIRDGGVSPLGRNRGFPGRSAISLLEDHAGRLWVGVDLGLCVYEHGRFRWITDANGQSVGVVQAMTEDVDGSIWAIAVRIDRGLRLVRIHDLKVREEISLERVPRARTLAADPNGGGLWLGLYRGDLARYRNSTLEIFPITDQRTKSSVQSLLVDPDGSVWAGTSTGLLRWKEEHIRRLDSTNGLPCESIEGIVRDNVESLWLTTECGIVAIADSELENWWKHPERSIKFTTQNVFDGTRSALRDFHASWAERSKDGRLWFVYRNVLHMVDPKRLARNTVPPIVHVEQIVADRRIYQPHANLQLPARTRDLEIDYSAPSFVRPQDVTFRYKLEGHDADWQDPKTRRQAFYNNLSPGMYQFRVIAANNDGVWNEAGASLQFSIAPAYYQTLWFRGAGVVAGAGFLWMLYLLRLRHLAARIRGKMEAQLAERERIARDLHDTLLQGTYGLILRFQAVADRIPSSEPARKMIEEALNRAEQVVVEGRDRVEGLRTRANDGVDLSRAFADIGDEMARDTGTELKILVEGHPQALHLAVRDEAYWIGREALVNAFHAANAHHVEVELIYDRTEMRLRIRDDGRGIDPTVLGAGGRSGHWGIRGMRERAGRIGAHLEISSRTAVGTEVDLRVPASLAYSPGVNGRPWRWLRRPLLRRPLNGRLQ